MFDLIAGIGLWLAALPALALFGLIIAGVILLGLLEDGLLGLFVLAALGFVLWHAGGPMAATLGGSIFYLLLWGLVAFILLFNIGRLMEKGKYLAFTLHMLVVLAMLATIFTGYFQFGLMETISATVVGGIVYFIAGLPVAFWKWSSYNRDKFKDLLKGQAQWLSRKKRELTEQERILQANANPTGQGYSRTERQTVADEDKFSDAEIAAIKALPDYPTNGIYEKPTAIPPALKDRWLKYVEKNDLKMPELGSSKALFFGWVAAWPGVLVFLLFDDFVERLINWVYSLVENVLGGIQRRIVGERTEFLR